MSNIEIPTRATVNDYEATLIDEARASVSEMMLRAACLRGEAKALEQRAAKLNALLPDFMKWEPSNQL